MRKEIENKQDKTGLAEVSDKKALHFCPTRFIYYMGQSNCCTAAKMKMNREYLL